MRSTKQRSRQQQLLDENAELRRQLEEAHETLTAIQTGAVDALVVHEPGGHRVYTLESADRPYRLLVEQMHQGAVTLDGSGMIVYSNLRFAEMLGRSQPELIGLSLVDVIAPEDRVLCGRMLQEARDGAGQCELSLARPDGSSMPALLTFNVLPAECGAVLGGLITDLTAQKHQEKLALAYEALQNSETRFRALIETSAQIVWTAGPDGRIVEDSPSWRAFTGQTLEEWTGSGWLNAIHSDDRERLAMLWRQAMDGRTEFEMECRIRRVDGVWRWTSCRAVPIIDSDGLARGWVAMSSDITERKRIQEERERLLALEQAARADAERANRMKDEFLATVSHELRTPLSAVLGWAHILRIGKLTGDKAAAALDTIERNARSQKQLIEDLLDVSAIITGKVRLDVRPLDPAAPVEAALAALQPAAEAKGVRLQHIVDSRVGVVSGDMDRLQQVVWNLLSNSVKFTPRGGRVQVRLERVDSHVEIVVSDTGAGIKPDFLPFVFDRFRQADTTRSRPHGGLGLGLAIVRHLVELHGGEVDVTSDGEGKGAKFTVKLPLVAIYERRSADNGSSADAGAIVEIDCPDRLDGLKILAVDDEEDTRDLLKAMLDRCGAEVTVAGSAKLGIEALEVGRFDIIISDIGMPETDGYEFIQTIRKLPAERGGRTPAIALSAYTRSEDRLRAFRAGFEMHVPKPIEYAELVAIMASLAARRDPPS